MEDQKNAVDEQSNIGEQSKSETQEVEANATEEQQNAVKEQQNVVKEQQNAVEQQPEADGVLEEEPPKKRGRGRPPKDKTISQNNSNSNQVIATKSTEPPLSPQQQTVPTSTGRPRRNVVPKVDANYVYASNAGPSASSSPTKNADKDKDQEPQTSKLKAGQKRKVKNEPEELVYELHQVPEGHEEGSHVEEVQDADGNIVQIVKIVDNFPDGENATAVDVENVADGETVDDGTSTVSAGKEDYNELNNADKDVDFPDGYLPTDDKKQPKKVYMKDPGDPARKFKCPYVGCMYVAKYRSNLWDHKKTHTGEKPYQCTWPDCSMRFSQTHQLKLHTRSHTGERPYKCTWPGCDAAFSQKPGLRSHALTHTGEKNFVCDFPGCNWAFRLKGALTDHKRAIHEDKKTHMCEWPGCGKRFLQSCHLKKHLMAHADIKPYACDWPKCTYKAVTMAYVTNHRRTHTGERNHECNFKGCHKKFVKSSHVNRHRQRCHPEMFHQNGEGEYVEQEVEYNDEEAEYTIQQTIPHENIDTQDNENLAENDQIVIEYSEQEGEIIIQSGNSQTIYKGQLVEDKDGGQYIISDGQMIPLHDILTQTEDPLKDGTVQEVYVKEEGGEEPEPQTV